MNGSFFYSYLGCFQILFSVLFWLAFLNTNNDATSTTDASATDSDGADRMGLEGVGEIGDDAIP